MDIIKSIALRNIKGKSRMDLSFNDLHANMPNILVAPNGYGKSTIATAFDALMSNKLELDGRDIYEGNPANVPLLKIELLGDNAGVYAADNASNTITQSIYTYVINSPVFAKSTARSFGGRHTSSATLGIRSITLFDRIPSACQVNYRVTNIRDGYANQGKAFYNLQDIFGEVENLEILFGIRDEIKKAGNQVGTQNAIAAFLTSCSASGSAEDIRGSATPAAIDVFKRNRYLNAICQGVERLISLPHGIGGADTVFSSIQIVKLFQTEDVNSLNSALKYREYLRFRTEFDARIADFNTTGRTIRTKETNGKLIIDFELADSMSNGERDILSFIANLTNFEIRFRKNIGILIIDEVFDYLDGSNILAVQYYLVKAIERLKLRNKVLFPIIFTHLDPNLFGNYYFKNQKVHYMIGIPNYNLNSEVARMLSLRESPDISDASVKSAIECYFIHYHSDPFIMLPQDRIKIGPSFSGDCSLFRAILFDEVQNKYLAGNQYDALLVTCGIRVKVEEILAGLLPPSKIAEFFSAHTTTRKIKFLNDLGIDTPEVLHLLQPLYNDGLHLKGNDNQKIGIIKGVCLKLDNIHIKRLVGLVFSV